MKGKPMTMHLLFPLSHPAAGLPSSEAELIRARIASNARWRRRLRWLRLRAALFGRPGAAPRPWPARRPMPRPALG
jgi:hypothetical protein